MTQETKRSEMYFSFGVSEFLNSVFLAKKIESTGKSISKWQKISQECYRVDWSYIYIYIYIYIAIFLKTRIHLVLINLLLYFSAKFLCLWLFQCFWSIAQLRKLQKQLLMWKINDVYKIMLPYTGTSSIFYKNGTAY